MRPSQTHPAPQQPGKKLLRADIAQSLQELGIPLPEALRILDTLTGAIADGLKAGHKVCLSGFGTFEAEPTPARRVRCPRIASGPGSFREVGPRVRYHWKAGVVFTSPQE